MGKLLKPRCQIRIHSKYRTTINLSKIFQARTTVFKASKKSIFFLSVIPWVTTHFLSFVILLKVFPCYPSHSMFSHPFPKSIFRYPSRFFFHSDAPVFNMTRGSQNIHVSFPHYVSQTFELSFSWFLLQVSFFLHVFFMTGCAGGVVHNGSEWENGEAGSNSSRIRYFRLRTNTHVKK